MLRSLEDVKTHVERNGMSTLNQSFIGDQRKTLAYANAETALWVRVLYYAGDIQRDALQPDPDFKSYTDTIIRGGIPKEALTAAFISNKPKKTGDSKEEKKDIFKETLDAQGSSEELTLFFTVIAYIIHLGEFPDFREMKTSIWGQCINLLFQRGVDFHTNLYIGNAFGGLLKRFNFEEFQLVRFNNPTPFLLLFCQKTLDDIHLLNLLEKIKAPAEPYMKTACEAVLNHLIKTGGNEFSKSKRFVYVANLYATLFPDEFKAYLIKHWEFLSQQWKGQNRRELMRDFLATLKFDPLPDFGKEIFENGIFDDPVIAWIREVHPKSAQKYVCANFYFLDSEYFAEHIRINILKCAIEKYSLDMFNYTIGWIEKKPAQCSLKSLCIQVLLTHYPDRFKTYAEENPNFKKRCWEILLLCDNEMKSTLLQYMKLFNFTVADLTRAIVFDLNIQDAKDKFFLLQAMFPDEVNQFISANEKSIIETNIKSWKRISFLLEQCDFSIALVQEHEAELMHTNITQSNNSETLQVMTSRYFIDVFLHKPQSFIESRDIDWAGLTDFCALRLKWIGEFIKKTFPNQLQWYLFRSLLQNLDKLERKEKTSESVYAELRHDCAQYARGWNKQTSSFADAITKGKEAEENNPLIVFIKRKLAELTKAAVASKERIAVEKRKAAEVKEVKETKEVKDVKETKDPVKLETKEPEQKRSTQVVTQPVSLASNNAGTAFAVTANQDKGGTPLLILTQGLVR